LTPRSTVAAGAGTAGIIADRGIYFQKRAVNWGGSFAWRAAEIGWAPGICLGA